MTRFVFFIKPFCASRHCSRLKVFLLSALLLLTDNLWAFSPFSNNELDKLQREFIQLINQSDLVLRNPVATQYINQLGRKLALSAKIPPPVFFIVKSNEINAFAGPGGYIGMNTQLILTTSNENELAGVMGHEMAHVHLNHLYRLLEHEKQMRVPMLAALLASLALGVINPTLGTGAMMASLTGAAQDNINFIRANEKEADRIGINMLIKAGFDPNGMPAFFKKMQENARYYYTDNIPAILRTHPMDEDRIAEAENRIMHLPKKSYPNNLDYRLFKELIRVSVAGNDKQLLDYYALQCLKHNNNVACQYGHALAQMHMNQYQAAETILLPLIQQYPNNLFFVAGLAQAEIGRQHVGPALARLQDLHNNFPENYAATMIYGQNLVMAGKAEQAAILLLKASRIFKEDLLLCQALANAQGAARMKSLAYFTEAQCHLLQGQPREALRQLNYAKTLEKGNSMLKERIVAKIDEIQDAIKDEK